MSRDTQRQRLQPATQRIGRLRIHDAAEQAAGLADGGQLRSGSGQDTPGHVAVPVQIFGDTLHRQIDSQLERPLVDRAGKSVVDASHHARGTTRVGDRPDVDTPQGRIDRSFEPQNLGARAKD